MLSVIMPIYNRRDNLLLCLAALDRQTERDFEVIVADDGSDDLPVEVLYGHPWHFRYLYVRQEHRGVRIGQARNLGVKIASGSGLVFIDSDVLLNPTAIGHYGNIHRANPSAIIAGRYDWLPPMDVSIETVQHNFPIVAAGECTPRNIGDAYLGIQGPDPRARVGSSMFEPTSSPRYDYCLALFSGNMLWPKKVFEAIGGFAEDMVGHGGEDCELAIRAQEAGVAAIFAEQVIGYHLWHPRDQERNMREVAENIKYIRAHHDLNKLGVVDGNMKAGELPLVGGAHAH